MALTRFQIWSGGWARLRSKNKKMNRTWESLVPLDLYSKQRSSPASLLVALFRQEKKVLVFKLANTSRSPDGQDNQRSAVYPCRGNTPQNPSLSRGEKKICRHADAGNNRLPNDLRERDPAEEPRDGDVVLATIHQSRHEQRDRGPTQAEETNQGPPDYQIDKRIHGDDSQCNLFAMAGHERLT